MSVLDHTIFHSGACSARPYVCFPDVICINIVGMNISVGSFECQDCPTGYTGNGINCTDIDEVPLE